MILFKAHTEKKGRIFLIATIKNKIHKLIYGKRGRLNCCCCLRQDTIAAYRNVVLFLLLFGNNLTHLASICVCGLLCRIRDRECRMLKVFFSGCLRLLSVSSADLVFLLCFTGVKYTLTFPSKSLSGGMGRSGGDGDESTQQPFFNCLLYLLGFKIT